MTHSQGLQQNLSRSLPRVFPKGSRSAGAPDCISSESENFSRVFSLSVGERKIRKQVMVKYRFSRDPRVVFRFFVV